MGVIYIGFAIGPDISSFVLHHTSNHSIAPLFIAAATCYFVVGLYAWLVIPESHHTHRRALSEGGDAPQIPEEQKKFALRRLVEPLASLRPRKVGALKKDYALTWIAVAYFVYLVSPCSRCCLLLLICTISCHLLSFS